MADVKEIALKLLVENSIQMSNRTTERSLSGMINLIKKSGFIAPILISKKGYEYIVCDGHRRWKAAESLGYLTIPIIELSDSFTPELWFGMLNSATKSLKGNDWFGAWAKNKSIEDIIPSGIMGEIVEMVKIFGEARTKEIALPGIQAPVVAVSIRRLSSVFKEFGLVPDSPRSTMNIGEWIIRHGQSYAVNNLLETKDRACVKRFAKAFKNDKPYPKE